MNPQYPVYVISKGRWEGRSTVKILEKMNVPYHIVIEEQEYEKYAQYINPEKILVLPFSNQGTSVPARNWVWQHSIDCGYSRHWILDDNIEGFHRFQGNRKVKVLTGTIFKAAEDFVDRYKNIALAGFNYFMFVAASQNPPPFYKNTRIYSCILVDNNIPFSWRGIYNEDTRLSLDVFKSGYSTVLFNTFLANKRSTQWKKGGNTDELYKNTNNRWEFAKELQDDHPDVVDIVWRYGRWHHEVDYSPFKSNELILRDDIEIPKGIDNYNLRMVKFKEPITLNS